MESYNTVFLRCIRSNESTFTVGKLYKVLNGTFISNCGYVYNKIGNWREFYPEHFTFEEVSEQEYNDYITPKPRLIYGYNIL